VKYSQQRRPFYSENGVIRIAAVGIVNRQRLSRFPFPVAGSQTKAPAISKLAALVPALIINVLKVDR
jgi:hypothetical protein